MAFLWILGFFLLALQNVHIYCQDDITLPPIVSGSYRAMGELVEELPDTPGYNIQVAFEENYDEENQKSAFTLWQFGQNVSYIENYVTNQTLKYTDNIECELVTLSEWDSLDAPPSLLGYEHDGQIRFSLKKLFSIDNDHLIKGSLIKMYRGALANLWIYEMKSKEDGNDVTLTVYSYWSNSTWTSTSGEDDPVPLGYEITKIVHKELPDKPIVKSQIVSVFAFVPGVVNKAVFEPKEGIYCDGNITSQIPFPRIPRMDAMSIHSEIALADYQDVKTVDIWYDMTNKLLRIDMDRITNQQPLYMKEGRRITWEITSQWLEATFEMEIYQSKLSCRIVPLDQYEFEVQDLINPKLPDKSWNTNTFFGVNTTDYRYIGKTTKRNIPCHMFQGRRTDWPESTSGAISLWEWCLAMNLTENDDIVEFRDGELPLVSLQIHIINGSGDEFPTGFRLMHHFYDVLAEDPAFIYDTAFDVSRCFNETEKRRLQFTVDVDITEDNLLTLENATSDPKFLLQWRTQISTASKIPISTLRIFKLRSTIYKEIMYIMFTLLEVHEDLLATYKHQKLQDAEADLRKQIDAGKLGIKYFYTTGKAPLDLKANKKSLGVQVDFAKIVDPELTTESEPVTGPLRTITETGTEEMTASDDMSGTVTGTATATGKETVTGTKSVTGTGTGTKSVTGTGTGTKSVTGTGTGTKSVTGTGTGAETATSTSTEPNVDASKKKASVNSPGTVAGVAIAMLIVGISAGAAGTYFKFRGLPHVLRRA